MSIQYDKFGESQKKYENIKKEREKGIEEIPNNADPGPGDKNDGALKKSIIQKFKEKDAKAPDQGKDNKSEGATIQEKIFALLKEIRNVRKLHKNLSDGTSDNRVKLADLKSSIDQYEEKIRKIEEEKRSLERYKEEYEKLKAQENDGKKGMEKPKPKNVAEDKIFAELIKLQSDNQDMEQEIISLERELRKDKKRSDEMKYNLERRVLEISASKITDKATKETIEALNKGIEERDGVIENLLQRRRLIPEEDRLVIVWLGAMLQEERKKNAQLKDDIKDLQSRF